jgi:hypothetical protein
MKIIILYRFGIVLLIVLKRYRLVNGTLLIVVEENAIARKEKDFVG